MNIKILSMFLVILFFVTLLTSCDNPFAPEDQAQPEDFSIAYIKRLPELDYIWGISNATRVGWPSVGEVVTWRGAIKSWSSKSQSVSYTWLLDGQEVDSGNIRIEAGRSAHIEVNWQWDFQRHELVLVIRFDRDGQNVSKSLKIYTDALSVKFYVEKSVYAAFQNKYSRFFKRSFASFDEIAQEWIRFWNLMYEKAVYPETPNGVLDRVRLDEIVIVEDDALPLAPQSHPDTQPNQNDRTTDYQFGFPKKYIENYLSPEYFKVVLHELGHARYLIDLYGFDVFDDRDSVLIKEEGRLITKSKYLPRQYGGVVVRTPERGLMNRETVDYGIDSLLSRYSAMALNLIAGQRARYGNYNAPENIGSFLNDLPKENVMTIRDQNGRALGGAKVELYRATELPGNLYGKYFDDNPDMHFVANEQGEVLFGRAPFSEDGVVTHWFNLSNAVLIVRVEVNNKIGYSAFDVTNFNMEYWRGHTDLGRHEITVTLFDKNEQ